MSIATLTREAYQPAVAYLHRSTDRQEQSIGDQRKALERYAEEHGFDLLDYYVDDAISGISSEERKAFLKLIEDAATEGCQSASKTDPPRIGGISSTWHLDSSP